MTSGGHSHSVVNELYSECFVVVLTMARFVYALDIPTLYIDRVSAKR